MAKVVSQNFCESSFPPLLSSDGSTAYTPSAKANLFASLFASNSNLDDNGKEPLPYPLSSVAMPPIKFSTRKVRKALQTLNTNKSKGPDSIPAIVLKTCAPELAPVLNKLFQLSYKHGIFPSLWKQVHVFPIPKKGDKSDPSNYRPIAISSLLSKVMETIITHQLLSYLETNQLLSDHQYGFRQARSTGDLLAYSTHVWSSTLDSFGESRVISLDISKAFDRVWHKGLLSKLPMYGLHPSLITWIGNFLSGRTISVRVDGSLSNPLPISSGVPQGSVLSPVLFLLFINDLFSSTLLSAHSFADDTYLSSSFSFQSHLIASKNTPSQRAESTSALNHNLALIEEWASNNLVKLNENKTMQLVVSRKRNPSYPLIQLNGASLTLTDSLPLLGLSISPDLNWKTHISSIAKGASRKLGFLFRARSYFTSAQLLTLYKSQIRPSIEYCSHVWGGAPQSSLSLLDKIQAKAIRLINSSNLTNNLQSLSHRRYVADLSIFYRFYHGHCSQEIQDIVPIPLERCRTTRSQSHAHPFQVTLSNCRTLSHSSSFIPRTSKLWNMLPPSTFPHQYNLNSFKRSVNQLNLCSFSSFC